MAPLLLKQLSILLWKSWIVRKRHWVSALFELLFPMLLTLVMTYVRFNETKHQSLSNTQTGWKPAVYFELPVDQKRFRTDALFNTNQTKYTVFYAPQSSQFAAAFMADFRNKYSDKNVSVIGLEGEDELSARLFASDESIFEFGLVFLSNASDRHLKVKIRNKNDQLVAAVKKRFVSNMATKPSNSLETVYEGGFSIVQIAVSQLFIERLAVKAGKQPPNVSLVNTHRIAYPPYLAISSDGELSGVQMAGMMIITGYVIICPLIVKRITDEKVAKAKEMLRMMGMSDWVFWGAHFVNFLWVMLVQSAVNAALYVYGFGGIPYVLYSSGFVLFVTLALFNVTSILSSMLLTTVFNRPIIAVVVSVLLFMLSQSVPMNLLDPSFNTNIDIDATHPWRVLTCFMPNSAMAWIFSMMAKCEGNGYGVHWNNLWDDVPDMGQLSVGLVMLIQFGSIFFYALLIWYVDNVWPFQFGIPKPLYFPFLVSYWFPGRNADKHSPVTEEQMIDQNANHFETEPTGERVGIQCHHLRKVFDNKVAVNDVSLNIYSGQITVLLGHNGAGKTTTMNMITGIFPPTSGSALIDGFDIRTQTKSARRSMALCPQDNILYNELSVVEHLKLYAVLKNHPKDDVEREVNAIVKVISLDDKRDALANELSGGMKRKLCLGVAMVADSQILVLDEPTSGMDPEARRHIWDVLQDIRTTRTILLTTHYMEEADQLGDRIAIMSDGMVKCCGTPMFLKRAFGAGYQLRIAKASQFDAQKVLSIVRQFVSNADIKSEIHSEIIFSLENKTSTDKSSALLAQLFQQLDARKAELYIDTCGLTVTTMEDVFLRVGQESEEIGETFAVKSGFDGDSIDDSRDVLFSAVEKNSGFALWRQQFGALFLKRFHYAKRYWPMVVLQSLVPGFMFMCILLLDQSIKKSLDSETKSLNLSFNLYSKSQGFIDSPINHLIPPYISTAATHAIQVSNITGQYYSPNNWTLRDEKLSNDISKYLTTYLVSAQIHGSADNMSLIAWYNKEAVHSLPLSIGLLYETLLRETFAEQTPTIEIHNHPIASDQTLTAVRMVRITLIVACLLLVPLTVPLIGASYVLFPIHERVSNSKLLQLMTGISSVTFWATSFVFDLINHLIASVFLFIIFAIFDSNKVFISSTSNGVGLFLMFFLFGVSAIPLAYLFSLRLKLPSTGYAALVIILLLTGLVMVLTTGVIDLMLLAPGPHFMTRHTLDVIVMAAHVLPVYSMSYGIQKLYKVGSYTKACRDSSKELLVKQCVPSLRTDDPYWGCCEHLCSPRGDCYHQLDVLRFDDKGVAVEFLFLVATGVFFLLLLWLIEGNFERILYFFNKYKSKRVGNDVTTVTSQRIERSEDSDVWQEKHRIDALADSSNEAIVVRELSKRFGKSFRAVNGLNFGVHKEECFGLLGVNGAGKTTTFRMLTGDETLTDGNAWIDGLDLRRQMKEFQTKIGYCPQFDALLDKMTGRETLFMFCRLRGMRETLIGDYVAELVSMVDLDKHVDKCTHAYSGGNKRKLSLAMALCATPPVIFLDEPTSGVDPTARRKIWSTLASLQRRYGSAFILTSHSMEECEALCARVAIMVNGQFQCLGSVQHLRSKFGQGFTVMAKLRRHLADESAYLADVQTHVQKALPSAVLKDVHQCLLHYHIADTSTLWSTMFAAMEDIKSRFDLEDYVISDTTLEQIFLSFARKQR